MTPLTQDEINKYITEKVLGKCWHDELVTDGSGRCSKCDIGLAVPMDTCIPMIKNPDYSKWEFYGPMLEECMKKEWWPQFLLFIGTVNNGTSLWVCSDILLTPALGSKAIAEFRGWREE